MVKQAFFIFVSFALASLATLTGCNRLWSAIEPVSGNGIVITQSRDVSAFDAVELDGGYTVILSQGPTTSLRIETDSNLMSYIKSEISSNKLLVKSESNLHPTKQILLYITSPNFRSIEADGAAEVSAQTPITSNDLRLAVAGSGSYDLEVHTENLASEIDGSGKFALRGDAKSHKIDISGSGDIRADSMQSESTSVDISGSGKATLLVSHALDAKVSGSGHVRYRGSVSELHTAISGSGSVEKMEN